MKTDVFSISVKKVNEYLDELAACTTFEKAAKAEKRIKIFRELARSLTAIQHKWLIRIILRDLKVLFIPCMSLPPPSCLLSAFYSFESAALYIYKL
jgi:hypothetical protein